jgi:hypothetical protein
MRALGLVALALLLAAPAIAAQPIKAKLATSTATPVVDQPWRWTVTVKSLAGKPLAARMRLQILLGETVVGCWEGGAMVQCFSQTGGSGSASRGNAPASSSGRRRRWG